ncbi:preprotein translocase subunit SecG [Actinobacillus equuli subsp. equuli]|uniref:Protein-export membrane protein SecG n=1 Tax=Actinobacillus equuli subsp. equuli TaxID=202947 RepID=A0A9X4G2M7_ACTEU|nr:preprotein translocase subunit SecG [Actinobacillus equuli]MDE8034687.1 preprotein translocase subunit SecG [Actinobacillus equuli subsp. equuli]MDG4948677.1 preprotein translocase subunit SecG [Actinobacillus equuli subsp. haemolyticus]
MLNVLTIIYLVVAIALVGFILMQQGKGADAGASFGAGAAGTVFGSAGSANFLSRTTAILAVIFFCISLLIGNLNSHQVAPKSQFEDLSGVQQKVEQPAKVETQNNDIPQ